ncbi:MAG: chloride channel protein, partial [Euryarchaeota archaeon]|nr:chloride channel protein [Euryarchaeota archaeon]MDE2046718.1 chloride channel protein [Thermoplasmata archaeon]
DLFRKLPVHWMWWPAIGGVCVGLGGLVDPRALGVGYDSIGLLLVGGVGIGAAALLLLVKGTIWTISLGSGTSGGVLAPLLMMGAATGTLVGILLPVGSPVLWALVAMAAILGGTMRAPFTGAIFAIELTRDLNVLLPLFVACLASEGVTIFTLRRSILTEKVARRGVHVAREYAVDPLETTPVSAVMHTDILHVPADIPVGEVVRLAPDITSRYVGYTLLAHGGGISGFTTKDAIVTYLAEGGDPMAKIESLAPIPSRVLYPDHPCRVGAAFLADLDVEAVPVSDPEEPMHVVGIFAREDLFRARVVALEDELQRDRTLRVTIPSLRWYRGPLGRVNPSLPEEACPRDSGGAPNPPSASTPEKEQAADPSEASAQPPP